MSRTIRYPKVDTRNFDGFYYPVDEYGHAGIMERGEDGEWYLRTTDPYDQIDYAISCPAYGDEDYFSTNLICFEYLILEAHVAIHATIDCESGHFLDTFIYEVVRFKDAVAEAEGIVDRAKDWFFENHPELSDEWWETEAQTTFSAALESDLAHIEDPEMI